MSEVPSRPVALVTGGARRIGRAICLDMASAGIAVAVHCRSSLDAAAEVVRSIEAAGGAAHVFPADLSEVSAARSLAAEVLAHFGRVDVLVHNASVFRPTAVGAGEESEAFDRHVAEALAVHVATPLALVDALLPALRASDAGSVVMLGDACARRADHAAYLASKAALVSLTRSLARDLAPAVRVNMVAPGSILPAESDVAPDVVPQLVASVPMGRLGSVEEVARTVRFLALGPGFVTGQVIGVDGGQYA